MGNYAYMKIFEPSQGIDSKLLPLAQEDADFSKLIWDRHGVEREDGSRSLEPKFCKMIEENFHENILPKIKNIFGENASISSMSVARITEEINGENEYLYCFYQNPSNDKVYYRQSYKYMVSDNWIYPFRKDDVVRLLTYYNTKTDQFIEAEDLPENREHVFLDNQLSTVLLRTTIAKALKNIDEYGRMFKSYNETIVKNKEVIAEINKEREEDKKIQPLKLEGLRDMKEWFSKFHRDSIVVMDYAELCMLSPCEFFTDVNEPEDCYNFYFKFEEKLKEIIEEHNKNKDVDNSDNKDI